MPPDPSLPWPIPRAAVMLIAEHEQGPGGGCALQAYRCPAGVPTIGWGETDGVRMGDVCTQAQADGWLLDDLTERARSVRALCSAEPTPNELGAFTSLAYNIGLGAFAKSTALRQHNAGNREAAARAIGLFDKARVNGVLTTLRGLTARRARETALYLTAEAAEPLPQAVEAESKLAASPINRSAAVVGAAGVFEGLRQWAGDVGGLQDTLSKAKAVLVDTLGVPPEWVLPLVLVGAAALIVRWRLRQRSGGYA